MRTDLRSERGITILETTVILSVLFILAGAMSPIVSESVNTARAVKARNDASMIAMGLINFQKDLGADAVNLGGAGVAAQAPRLPGLLATGLAGALLFAYVLQGLAVIHVYSRGVPLRGLLLATIYLGILLLGWVAIAVAIVGLAEPLLGLRQRANRGGQPPNSGGTV